MLKLHEQAFQKFVYGRYLEPSKQPLSTQQQKVYNMSVAGFPRETIATRLSVTVSAIDQSIVGCREKGWEI